MMNKILVALFTTTCISHRPAFVNGFLSLQTRNLHKHLFVMNSSTGNLQTDQPVEENEEKKGRKSQRQTKVHSVTVCVVPPPENVDVWRALSAIRQELKDPGYYRWPPHVNLLYPFIELPHHSDETDIDGKSEIRSDGASAISDIVKKLESETRNISPFSIQLNKFGTFGGKKRGVLWLHPECTGELPEGKCEDTNQLEDGTSPLVRLQTSLEKAFPMCQDRSKKGTGFTPHMTVSHFPSLDEAMHAKGTMEASLSLEDINKDGTRNRSAYLDFVLDRIYLLQRQGDDGQFLRVAEIGLGMASQTRIFDPPEPFPDMPQCEDEWVKKERMLLKARRKGNRKSRRKSN